MQARLNQSSLPVICDEGIQQPKQFKCLIPMLGGFHMAKALLHCIGKFIKINGLF